MASGQNLRLQVVLAAIDKITGPLKGTIKQAQKLSAAIKDNQAVVKQLNNTQARINGLREAVQQARQSTQAFRAAQERVQSLARQMRSSGGDSTALARQLAQARNEVVRASQKMVEHNQKAIQLKNALRAAGIDTSRLGTAERKLRNDLAGANRQIEEQRRRLERLNQQQKRLNQAQGQYQGAMNARNSLAGKGAGMMAGGGAALFGASRILSVGLDFDATMSKVQALTRLDKGSAALQELRDQARHLGATTTFSASDAARGQAFLAMAGFTPAAIKAAMPGVLDMARAGDVDLGVAADISSNILSGFGLQASEMGRVSDVLVGAFTRSNTSLEMLGETMKYCAPVAAALKVPIEDAAAMAGKLGDAGIQASQAGTSMRAIMNRLAGPPKMAAEALDTLNISAKDAQGNFRAMPDILTELYEKTKDMGSAERTALLKKIAGAEAAASLLVLVEQAGTGKLQEMIGDLRAAQVQLAKEVSTRTSLPLEELDAAMKAIAPTAENLGIPLKTAAAMIGNLGVAGITGVDGVEGLKAVMQQLTEPSKEAAKAMKAIGVEVTDAEGRARSLPDILEHLQEKTENLTEAQREALFKTIGGDRKGALALAQLVKDSTGALGDMIIELDKVQGEAAKVAKGMADNMGGDLDALLSAAKDIGISIFDSIDKSARKKLQSLTAILRDIGDWAKDNPKTVALITKIVLGVAALVTVMGGLSLALSSVIGPFALMRYGMTILGVKVPIAAKAIALITKAFNLLKIALLTHPILAIFAGIALAAYLIISNWDDVKVYFFAILDAIVEKAIAIWTDIKTAFDGGLVGVIALLEKWSPLNVFYGWIKDIAGYFNIELPATFEEFGANIISGLINGITGRLAAAKEAVMTVGSDISGWFAEKLGIHSPSRVFAELGGFTMAGLALGLQTAAAEPIKAVGRIADDLTLGMGSAIEAPSFAAPSLIAASGSDNSGNGGESGALNISITINTAPGMDEAALAQLVADKIAELQQKAARQRRSQFQDFD